MTTNSAVRGGLEFGFVQLVAANEVPKKRRRPLPVAQAPVVPVELDEVAPGVVEQVRIALRPGNRLATSLGAVIGGLVPLASYQLAHHEIRSDAGLLAQPAAWLVLGGLLFSALTVAQWARVAFGQWAKAIGFTVILEGCLMVSQTPWLGVAALMVLVGINAVSAGVKLSRGG